MSQQAIALIMAQLSEIQARLKRLEGQSEARSRAEAARLEANAERWRTAHHLLEDACKAFSGIGKSFADGASGTILALALLVLVLGRLGFTAWEIQYGDARISAGDESAEEREQ